MRNSMKFQCFINYIFYTDIRTILHVSNWIFQFQLLFWICSKTSLLSSIGASPSAIHLRVRIGLLVEASCEIETLCVPCTPLDPWTWTRRERKEFKRNVARIERRVGLSLSIGKDVCSVQCTMYVLVHLYAFTQCRWFYWYHFVWLSKWVETNTY